MANLSKALKMLFSVMVLAGVFDSGDGLKIKMEPHRGPQLLKLDTTTGQPLQNRHGDWGTTGSPKNRPMILGHCKSDGYHDKARHPYEYDKRVCQYTYDIGNPYVSEANPGRWVDSPAKDTERADLEKKLREQELREQQRKKRAYNKKGVTPLADPESPEWLRRALRTEESSPV